MTREPSFCLISLISFQVKLLDRALLPGDVVQFMPHIQPSDQMGIVSDCKVQLVLRVLGTNQVFEYVSANDFEDISPIAEELICLYKNWVGYVTDTSLTVTLETADGSILKMSDYDFLLLEDVSTERSDRCHFEDFPFVGQKVVARKQQLRYASWISRTDTSHIYSSRRFPPNFKLLMTVKNVELERIDVKWLYCVAVNNRNGKSQYDLSSLTQPPADVISGDDLKLVRQLNYFGKNSLQTGDRGYYVVRENDVASCLTDWQHRLGDDTMSESEDHMETDEQKEAQPVARDTIPVYTSKRQIYPKKKSSVPVKRIRNKRLKPAKRLDIRSQNARLTKGSRVAVEVIATETLVSVIWQNAELQESIPSSHLLPVRHVDNHELFPGDFVVENKSEFTYDRYAVVKQVDHSARTAVIMWFKDDGLGNPKEDGTESVSVYDIKGEKAVIKPYLIISIFLF